MNVIFCVQISNKSHVTVDTPPTPHRHLHKRYRFRGNRWNYDDASDRVRFIRRRSLCWYRNYSRDIERSFGRVKYGTRRFHQWLDGSGSLPKREGRVLESDSKISRGGNGSTETNLRRERHEYSRRPRCRRYDIFRRKPFCRRLDDGGAWNADLVNQHVQRGSRRMRDILRVSRPQFSSHIFLPLVSFHLLLERWRRSHVSSVLLRQYHRALRARHSQVPFLLETTHYERRRNDLPRPPHRTRRFFSGGSRQCRVIGLLVTKKTGHW